MEKETAKKIIPVTDGDHVVHVLRTDAEVAAFIKEDGGIIAVVDYSVAHHFAALLPLAPLAVFLGVSGRHRLYEAHAVA